MSERLIIGIDLDGDSLTMDYLYEIKKLLSETAERLGRGASAGNIQDTNGNTVGHFRIERRGT